MEHSGFVLFGEASCRERTSIFSCAVILGVPGFRVMDHAAGLGQLLTALLVAATPRVNARSSTMKRIASG